MYVCLECGEIFDEPDTWSEYHPYGEGYAEELWSGCPSCNGAYVEAFKCDCCDEWINDDYFEVEDKKYCKDCCQLVKLG